MPNMQESLRAFSDRLLEISTTLEQQKSDVGQAEKKVFSILDQAAAAFAPGEKGKSSGEKNIVRETVDSVFSDLKASIELWKKEMADSSEVRNKLEEMGSGLVVAVFGRTNVGKSTLGNFFRGRQLRVAAFDNAWKRGDFPLSPIKVIERDKDAEAVADAEWFEEGCVETTREAQMFSLPGLLWLDTPGFGSVNDGTLGALARKYVKRADLVIYLDDSESPGLENITARLLEVMLEGRRVLVAINQSDKKVPVRTATGKCVYDENKRPLRIRVPKTPEVRADQEQYLKGVLQERLADAKVTDKDVNAISISMLLATMAVEDNNEEQYLGSNVHALLTQILNQIPDNKAVTRLKYQDAVNNCMNLVNMVRGGEEASEQGLTLAGLAKRLAEMERHIADTEAAFDAKEEARAVVAPIMLYVREQLRALLQAAETQADEAGEPSTAWDMLGGLFGSKTSGRTRRDEQRSVSLAPLMQKVSHDALEGVMNRTRQMLNDLWVQPAVQMGQNFPVIKEAIMSRQTETYVVNVTDTEDYERDPSGVLEHLSSFIFDTKYL